jgi:predicted phage terminase large subunit-like protein
MTREEKEQLVRVLLEKNRRKYNTNFYEFFKDAWKAVDPYTELQENWHIHYLSFIAQKLTIQATSNKKPPHTTVLINVPPRSLKSWIFNIALPVWAWTLNPSLPIITASYSEVLALGFARKSQSIIKSDWFKQIYGDHVIIDQAYGGREAVGETQTSTGGLRFSTSTGGTIVGKGFLLGIIDDPIKPDDAREEKALQKNLNFWVESFDTRRNDPKKAVAIVIMQRVAENDMSGHLVELYENDPDFLHINLPAVADGTEKVPYLEEFLLWCKDNKYNIRKKDIYELNYLFGRRFDTFFIEKQKRKGAIFWNTQYQQNPLPTEGLTFKREWFEIITYEEYKKRTKNKNLITNFVTDTAYTKNTLNDPSAILSYTSENNIVYLTNFTEEYIDSAKLPEWIEKTVTKNNYTNRSTITIEPKGSGLVVISLTKEHTNLNVAPYKFPKAAKVNINMSKEERAEAITPICESGKVVLVKGGWNERFLQQLTTFPLAKHDEAVDTLVMAVLRAHYIDNRLKRFGVSRRRS